MFSHILTLLSHILTLVFHIYIMSIHIITQFVHILTLFSHICGMFVHIFTLFLRYFLVYSPCFSYIDHILSCIHPVGVCVRLITQGYMVHPVPIVWDQNFSIVRIGVSQGEIPPGEEHYVEIQMHQYVLTKHLMPSQMSPRSSEHLFHRGIDSYTNAK